MKKLLALVLGLICLTFLSSCQRSYSDLQMSSSSIESVDVTGPKEDYIVQIEHLNLDGVGGADDSIYSSCYIWGDFGVGATVIQVQLGSGERLAKVIAGVYTPIIQTGYLMSEEKESIVVELIDHASTYSTMIHLLVLDVDVNGSNSIVSLNTSLSIENSFCETESSAMFSLPILLGTEIIAIDNTNVNGLLLQVLNYADRDNNLSKIAFWKNDEWVISEVPSAENVTVTADDFVPPWSGSAGSNVMSALLDGNTILIPNMKFDMLSPEYRETLELTDDSERLPEGEPDRDYSIIKTYENDNVVIKTIAYTDDAKTSYGGTPSDIGVEYIRSVLAKNSNVSSLFLGLTIGSKSPFGEQEGSFAYAAQPILTYSYKDGYIVGLYVSSPKELDVIKYSDFSDLCLTYDENGFVNGTTLDIPYVDLSDSE